MDNQSYANDIEDQKKNDIRMINDYYESDDEKKDFPPPPEEFIPPVDIPRDENEDPDSDDAYKFSWKRFVTYSTGVQVLKQTNLKLV